MIVKPWVAVIGLYLLVRRKWWTLAGFAATLALIVGATAAIFGPSIFVQYLHADQLVTAYNYAQDVNQSLLGVLLRHGPELAVGRLPVLSPWYLGIATAMTGWSIVCLFRLREGADEWALALTIVLGLILYPPTLEHYSVMLLIPVTLWWRDVGERRGQAALATGLIVATFLLVVVKMAFAAMLLAWCALWLLSWRSAAAAADEQESLVHSSQPGHTAAGRREL